MAINPMRYFYKETGGAGQPAQIMVGPSPNVPYGMQEIDLPTAQNYIKTAGKYATQNVNDLYSALGISSKKAGELNQDYFYSKALQVGGLGIPGMSPEQILASQIPQSDVVSSWQAPWGENLTNVKQSTIDEITKGYGTPGYLSPQQFKAQNVTLAAQPQQPTGVAPTTPTPTDVLSQIGQKITDLQNRVATEGITGSQGNVIKAPTTPAPTTTTGSSVLGAMGTATAPADDYKTQFANMIANLQTQQETSTKNLTGIQSQISTTEDLLNKLESDINARVSGRLVTQPYANRLLATEQKPLVQTLSDLERAAGIEQTGLTSARQQMSDLISAQQTMEKAPETIGTAETGYYQWNANTGKFEQAIAPIAKTTNLDTSLTEVGGNKVLINNQTGEVIKNLGPTGTGTGGLDSATLSKVSTIANGFDNEAIVKQYNTIAESVYANNSAGITPTDDMARVYTFAKVMDPNSVVRESEYKTVQDYATALWQNLGLKGVRVFSNTGFLTDEARKFMQDTLDRKLKASQMNYDNVFSEYGRRIDKLTGLTDGISYLTDYSKAFPVVPTEVSVFIEQGLKENKSLNQIRTDLAGIYGQDTGFRYLDKYMQSK